MNLTKKIAEKQDNLNELTVKGWKNKGLNFRRALRQEASEAMDSTPWKWWKSGELDKENLRVEAVDMVHFAMSILLQEEYFMWDWIDERVRDAMRQEYPYSDDILVEKIEDTIDEIILMTFTAGKTSDAQTVDIYLKVMALAKMLGMSYEDVYKAYFAKNVLNEFRQKNGYKEGFYSKLWFGKEDNVYAQEAAANLEISQTFEDDLYKALEEKYREYNKYVEEEKAR